MQLKMGIGVTEVSESGKLFDFSLKGGRDLAHVTPDGRLLVWDASRPKGGGSPLEYVPSSHLSSAPTCLSWSNFSSGNTGKGKKKRRSISTGAGELGDLLALGTSSGSILLYSAKKNDVVSTLHTQNGESITSLAWRESTLYAGGAHGHLFTFNTSKSLLSGSHVYGKGALTAIAQPPTEPHRLLLASNVISLVCLDTHSVLQTLSSHSGQIHILSMLNTDLFISGSSSDKVLNVWSVSQLSAPVFTLSVKEAGITGVDSVQDEEKVLRIAVVTESGALKLYGKELDAASPSKNKPLKPISTVQIAANKDDNGKVKPLPILCSQFNDMDEIRIAYGEQARPQFEVLKVEELEKESCLTRSSGLEGPTENAAGYSTNLQVPSLKSGVVVPSSGVKRKTPSDSSHSKGALGAESLTMIDRLKLLSKEHDPKTSPPRSDSLLQLLLQGLHNKDDKILNTVLDRTELTIMDNTAKKLPVEAIVPLIEELQRFLRGRGSLNQCHANWLKSILLHHSTFLMSLPNCDQVLGSMISMLEERTRNFPALIQLQGKLNLITKQMTEHSEPSVSKVDDINREALLVYQNDSDDELPKALDELLLPASDTDDNWEDDSEDDEEEDNGESTDDNEVELLNGDNEDEDNEVEMESD